MAIEVRLPHERPFIQETQVSQVSTSHHLHQRFHLDIEVPLDPPSELHLRPLPQRDIRILQHKLTPITRVTPHRRPRRLPIIQPIQRPRNRKHHLRHGQVLAQASPRASGKGVKVGSHPRHGFFGCVVTIADNPPLRPEPFSVLPVRGPAPRAHPRHRAQHRPRRVDAPSHPGAAWEDLAGQLAGARGGEADALVHAGAEVRAARECRAQCDIIRRGKRSPDLVD